MAAKKGFTIRRITASDVPAFRTAVLSAKRGAEGLKLDLGYVSVASESLAPFLDTLERPGISQDMAFALGVFRGKTPCAIVPMWIKRSANGVFGESEFMLRFIPHDEGLTEIMRNARKMTIASALLAHKAQYVRVTAVSPGGHSIMGHPSMETIESRNGNQIARRRPSKLDWGRTTYIYERLGPNAPISEHFGD